MSTTTEPPVDRETWLAAKPVRSPEVEQAIFAGDVPGAADLDLADINPSIRICFASIAGTTTSLGFERKIPCISTSSDRPVAIGR